MIPPWLAEGNRPDAPDAAGGGTQSFLEKTIQGIARFTSATILCDLHACRPGFLQKIDPRFKLSGILALMFFVSLLHSPWSLGAIFLLALALASLSGIGPLFFTRRILPLVLLFGLVPALPALLNVITPGEKLLVVTELGQSRKIGPYLIPAQLAVTREGLQVAVVFIGRVAASVSLALLLSLTTRWNELNGAFAGLRAPRLFILLLAMTYRYIALLVRAVAELHDGRKSRTVRYLGAGREQKWVAGAIGYLFGRTYRLSEEVHDAMLSRGFCGEIASVATTPPDKRDVAWLMIALLTGVTAVVLDRQWWNS